MLKELNLKMLFLWATALAGHHKHSLTNQQEPAFDKLQSFLQVLIIP